MDFKLPIRKQDSNKSTFGRVLNVAGSKYMPGAAYLSSVSALKTGCGYCFLATEESVMNLIGVKAPNIVFLPFEDIEKQHPDIVSIGCGLSKSERAKQVFSDALKCFFDVPMVIDADGLNLLAESSLPVPEKLVITPHPMEASRLLGQDVEYIVKNREHSALLLAEKFNCVVVLKGHNTVVCDNCGHIYINQTGNSSLAKAGSGDVLTGIISGLIAQGLDLFDSAKTGVYLHGLSAEFASETLTQYSVMADDLIDYLPEAIKYCVSN